MQKLSNMKRQFAAIGDKNKIGTGWPLAFVSGKSCKDDKDWSIEILYHHSDEVPNELNDAKDFSELIAGLLNCYYNEIETYPKTVKQLMEMGRSIEELNIPHPNNTEIPF
jgi:hypothetical protein